MTIDLDALDKWHQPAGQGDSPEWCEGCELRWPCPTSTLIRVVRKQNEALVRAQDHLAYVSERDEAWQVEQARAVVAALVDLGEPT